MENCNEIAEKLKVMGHPDRIRIVAKLMGGGCNVSGIQQEFNLAQATVSQHMGLLKRTGIVAGERCGNEVCYKIVDDLVKDLLVLISRKYK